MHTLTNAATVTTLENLWGVIYFEEDGTVLCTDFLDATDYSDAAEQALEEADGGEFQLVEGLDIVGLLVPAGNRELFGPSIYSLLIDLLGKDKAEEGACDATA
ncbi:hypothetical protein [Rhizobium glycinendophyticum]|uniref:Uncharacterized protein n=1 Tax=Rhizobium glycinendophyticum TaxID=2589807 RepID=A0A504UKV5_9HYPH|nr:hypothetical protein [Rhizobium glycinendophyticum]TPP09786.1 hypothetical protein FJQ55_02590 [Rhizobium glycinendophyticum]